MQVKRVRVKDEETGLPMVIIFPEGRHNFYNRYNTKKIYTVTQNTVQTYQSPLLNDFATIL
jgi:hypothetical protein